VELYHLDGVAVHYWKTFRIDEEMSKFGGKTGMATIRLPAVDSGEPCDLLDQFIFSLRPSP
jgi:hypothetical protein